MIKLGLGLVQVTVTKRKNTQEQAGLSRATIEINYWPFLHYPGHHIGFSYGLRLAIIHVAGGWVDGLTENIASLASLRVSTLGRVSIY